MPLPALHAQGHEATAGPVSPASPCDRASLHQVGTVSLTGGQGGRPHKALLLQDTWPWLQGTLLALQ